jgi:crotonobetainyl-CoA:carnitine CoA-transferase CaiB-like acyl-CoA transferase
VPLRAKNRAALIAHLNDVLRSKPSQFWVAELNKAGVPCGPINTIDQVVADPQVKHLGIRRPVDHPKLGTYDIIGQPIHMSAFPQPERLRPTPDQGEHTDEVLRELGYDAAAIEELHAKAVV